MQAARERKAVATLGLVFATVKEKIGWRRFVEAIQRYVADAYGAFLTLNAETAPVDNAVSVLIDTLGEERAILAAYRVAEELLDDKPLPNDGENNGTENPRDDAHTLGERPESDEDVPKASAESSPGTPARDLTAEAVIVYIDSDSGGEDSGEEEEEEEEQEDEDEEEDEEEEDEEEDEEEEEGDGTPESTPSTVIEAANLSPIGTDESHGEPDGEPDDDGDDGEDEGRNSDEDSGYYSADGGPDRSPPPSVSEQDRPPSPVAPLELVGDRGDSDHGEPDSTAPSDGPGEAPSTDGVDEEQDQDEQEGETAVPAATAQPAFDKCLQRQAMMLTGALKDALPEQERDVPLCVDSVQYQLERYIFNPDMRAPPEYREVRFNFYPPFMRPKAIANYHIFAVTAPIPASCKANRSGSQLLEACRDMKVFKRLPRWRLNVQSDDGLGDEVVPVTELTDAKLVPLKDDVSRLQWAKMRGEHIRFFSYPSLHMPPKISRMLMECLLQPFANENDKAEQVAPCVSDEELRLIVDPEQRMRGEELYKAMLKRRAVVTMAVRYTALLELMQRVFREPSSVKKAQEVLHHTLHHGFVAQVRETAKVNLSNYATYHGVTYNDPLNNCTSAKLFEGRDKEDYVLDTVYLFLVLNWQTAMGMWQQAIDDTTLDIYAKAFTRQRRAIYSLGSVTEVSKVIVDILMDGDRLTEEMRKALPNFVTQSQISDFRHFVTERSNVPSMAAPFYPSDFVPLAFRQSAPLLWDQVYLLQIAFFLTNHGGYLWEPPESEAEVPQHRTYCPCNLCSPHRMPADNVALHNEVLAIGTFEIRSAEGKSFRLTPELWANAYLDKFVPEDFHPFTVFHFPENRSSFTKNHTGCVTESPEILSLIRQIQASREEFLLTRGKGLYKDPQTGETLTTSVGAENRPGASGGAPLPPAAAGTCGGAPAPPKPPRALRSACPAADPDSQSDYGDAALASNYGRYGSEDAGRENQSYRRPSGTRERRSLPYGRPVRGGFARGGGPGSERIRRRNVRKPGHRGGSEYHLGGGGGGPRRDGEREYPTAALLAASGRDAESQAPFRILAREGAEEASDPKESQIR